MALLGDDFHPELRLDALGEPKPHLVDADELDGLGELDLAPVDGETLSGKRHANVLRRDGTEESSLVADLLDDPDDKLAQLDRRLARLFLRLFRAREDDGFLVLNPPHGPSRRDHRELARKQKAS